MGTKDPKKVKAGQARQRQLRAQLGEDGYRAYQQDRYADALAAHPTLHADAARAANATQIAAWGQHGYTEQRKAAIRVRQARHGPGFAHQFMRAAHEERRHYRLAHPTLGEAALRKLLLPICFEYLAWRADPNAWQLGSRDAIAEGGVGRFYCDILLPLLRVAIEVEGSIHRLTRDHDAQRYAFLAAQDLTVVVLPETMARDGLAARQHLLPVLEDTTRHRG
jgi:hypothetical protein